MIDTTKLRSQFAKRDVIAEVLDLGSGSFPRIISTRLEGVDGAAQMARWYGQRALNVGDKLICQRNPNDSDVLMIDQPGAPGRNHSQVVFVSKDGSDADSGLTPNSAKLTIGAAITAAVALTPSASNRIRVEILDAGTYTEDITCEQYVDVQGESAVLDGTVILKDNQTLRLREINPSSGNNEILIQKQTGSSEAYAYVDRIDSRNVTNSTCVDNKSANSTIFIHCVQMYVGAGNEGVGDQTAGTGHIHVLIPDLYLAGNNAIGIVGNSNNASIIGYIDHILEIGSPTGTTAIDVGSSGAVYLTCTQIIADTAYNIASGGVLGLVCADINGTRTGTPSFEVSGELVTTDRLNSVGGAGIAVGDDLELASGTDIYIAGDEAGIKERTVDIYQTNITDHFDDNTFSGLSWASGYLSYGTPTNIDQTTYPSQLLLYNTPIIESFAYNTFTAEIIARCQSVLESKAGISVDDGTASNYYQLYLEHNNVTKSQDLKAKYAVGGSVTGPTTLVTGLPAGMFFVLRLLSFEGNIQSYYTIEGPRFSFLGNLAAIGGSVTRGGLYFGSTSAFGGPGRAGIYDFYKLT